MYTYFLGISLFLCISLLSWVQHPTYCKVDRFLSVLYGMFFHENNSTIQFQFIDCGRYNYGFGKSMSGKMNIYNADTAPAKYI